MKKDEEIYTEEELNIFHNIESLNYTSIKGEEFFQKKALLEKVADNTLKYRNKKKSLNIRLFEDDLEKIKSISMREGLPYQTFLSSVIHKVATGQLKAY